MFGQLLLPILTALIAANPVPDQYRARVDSNLNRAGPNGSMLHSALQELTIQERVGAAFLIANMPTVDLVEMDAATFTEHVRYAYRARREFAWTRDLPEDAFLHFVLPYRMSQEPVERWRKFFYDSLAPRVKDAGNAPAAALEVNRWCGERIKFKATQRRDQGPFETLKSGYGRCEEMMIFYVAAARSVGIAARQVWTPYWPMMDNNHAWVEIWDGARWSYLGACEPAPTLNQAWFSNTVKKAALVYASCFGSGLQSEEIYRRESNAAIVNVTAQYVTNPCTLEVLAQNATSEPLTQTPVHVYVFNFGGLRPIARLVTGQDGRVALTINQGEYFVSFAAGNSKYFGKVVLSKDGKHTYKLTATDSPVTRQTNWLRYQ